MHSRTKKQRESVNLCSEKDSVKMDRLEHAVIGRIASTTRTWEKGCRLSSSSLREAALQHFDLIHGG